MRPKTIILDIDGTILHHFGSLTDQIQMEPVILAGVIEKLNEWDRKGYYIVLFTGRKESMRALTEKQLQSCGIFYDHLVMGIGGGTRILINDLKPSDNSDTAIAINLERNKGLTDVDI